MPTRFEDLQAFIDDALAQDAALGDVCERLRASADTDALWHRLMVCLQWQLHTDLLAIETTLEAILASQA